MSTSNPKLAGTALARTRLRCFWCGAERPPDLRPCCDRCGGSLVAEVHTDAPVPDVARSLWDFRELLPVADPVSLGEGATPLLRLERLFPDDAVYVKADWMNPTGSFKDRAAAVGVSAALALGAEGIVCASTGNNGAAVSAYAARAGLPCIVTLPEKTPPGKVAQARAAGATVAAVPGTFSDAYRFAQALAEASGWANLTSTYINPYMTAAHASIAFELQGQLGEAPGSVLMPVGAGPMLDGVMAGARYLARSGGRLPVPVAVQAAACAPIAAAFAAGEEQVQAWTGSARTMAGSIADPLNGYPEDGTRTLRLVRKYGGYVMAVDEAELGRVMEALARHEGILAEPASVTVLAALHLAEQQGLKLPRPVVLMLSGHALKDPASLYVDEGDSFRADSLSAVDAVVARALDRFRR